MPRGNSTKERILKAAEELMLANSFHSVGLSQILSAVNVPKGSFYHHFSSKEEFGIELLRHYVSETSATMRGKILAQNLDANPLERLFSYLEECLAGFQASGGKCPCLIVKLAAEVSTFSEGMRATLAEGFDEWVSIYFELLELAKEENLLPQDYDSNRNSQLIYDVWYGALQRSLASCSIKPLRNAVKIIHDTLPPSAMTTDSLASH